MRDGGKGDKKRPVFNQEQFESNWENIFGNKHKPVIEEVDEGVYLITAKFGEQAAKAWSGVKFKDEPTDSKQWLLSRYFCYYADATVV